MYYKKVWVYILIIVVISSLFPSILVYANDGDGGGGAGGIPVEGGDDEGDNGDGEIPDLEYSLQNAPFPGNYNKITEATWQAFINRAEELGHTEIKKLDTYQIISETVERYKEVDIPIFYSTDGTDIEEVMDIGPKEGKWYWFNYTIKFKDEEKINILRGNYGHETSGPIGGYSSGWGTPPYYWTYTSSTWYRADLVNVPYQDMPERYNIDPKRGWGMHFLKPAFGEWVNVPHALGTYKDYIEIEVQIPQIYEATDGITYRMFEVNEGIGQLAIPNFAIKLTSNNVKKIYGSQVVGRDGTWILPKDIKFVNGYMDGSYMHSAKFIASIPIDHAKPPDGGHSLIVADLVLYEVVGRENYSVEIPEARTWTKYLTYLGTVDSDGDGYDDRTGLPINQPKPGDSIKDDKPNKDDYDDGILGTISYYFDTLIWYIKQPFVFIADLIGNIINWITTTIDGWIDGFTSIFTKLFSFLPAEVILMLALGFATMMIITIIRAIRGS